jgi:Putative restriction endonuclease
MSRNPPQCDGIDAVPPLENGDHLTRAEFERRYDAMPDLKNAELIEGVVYMRLKTRFRQHAAPHAKLCGWVGTYLAYTKGIEAGSSSHIRLDWDNMPQPDCVLFIPAERGGQSRIDQDGYIAGAPEMVAEVATSRVSYDLHDKLHVYRRAGVSEYVVWRVLDGEIDWFVNRQGRFERLPLSADGIFRSTVFPGLWLDPAALLRGDVYAVLAIVQQGLNTPEHADFVAGLERLRAV